MRRGACAVREPTGVRVPVLLPPVRRGHVPPHWAGVIGGRTVPESVAEHPLLCASFTARSFGRVPTSGRCHLGDPTRRCPQGRPLACGVVHVDSTDGKRSAGLLGQPLCSDCYDYASHLVWQWFAPDLWRRFTIALHRGLAHHLGIPANALPQVATVQYAKVAEFRGRGADQFHALIRLDGPVQGHGSARCGDS